MKNYEYIIVGSGYSGSVCARLIAEKLNKKVLVLEKRNHIAGNAYDEINEDGILIHTYGPHIFHTSEENVFEFLSRFTEWLPYKHTVRAEIDGTEVPLPINFTSIDLLFDNANEIKQALISEYGEGVNLPILKLKQSENELVKQLADFVFEKVFFHYTKKMWGLTPEEIGGAVTARIPVRLSYEDGYFNNKYQFMPKDGYTKMFENILNHPNIIVKTGVNAKDHIAVNNDEIYIDNEKYNGKIIWTGRADELFDFDLGELSYRSLDFEFTTHNVDYIQQSPVLNWPDDRPATRRTEMKRLTGQVLKGKTTTLVEYPGQYKRNDTRFGEPFYPIDKSECIEMYQKYADRMRKVKNLYAVGRLADYKYYDMDASVKKAIELFETVLNNN